jgi:hypothetical protein
MVFAVLIGAIALPTRSIVPANNLLRMLLLASPQCDWVPSAIHTRSYIAIYYLLVKVEHVCHCTTRFDGAAGAITDEEVPNSYAPTSIALPVVARG